MSNQASLIADLIRQALPGCTVDVDDLVGDGRHWSVVVRAEAFRGKTRIEQHRMVYDALEGQFNENLHALAIQTEAL